MLFLLWFVEIFEWQPWVMGRSLLCRHMTNPFKEMSPGLERLWLFQSLWISYCNCRSKYTSSVCIQLTPPKQLFLCHDFCGTNVVISSQARVGGNYSTPSWFLSTGWPVLTDLPSANFPFPGRSKGLAEAAVTEHPCLVMGDAVFSTVIDVQLQSTVAQLPESC